jgi:hypothetical protein
MTINRRRAPSSEISREKKLSGHLREDDYAILIDGETIGGTQKADVKDKKGNLYSVKSGKKWQVFLYGYDRISVSSYLNILQPCLDAFTKDPEQYFKDRIKCIEFKEAYIKEHGREKAKKLSNNSVIQSLGSNTYIESKEKLAKSTAFVRDQLECKDNLRNFLCEALFNNEEVLFLVIKDTTYKKDDFFKVFAKDDVLDIFTEQFFPEVSKAGNVPEDYNVAAQKTLLCYLKSNGKSKNIIEIEIRNDSNVHYRQVRFNMYSKDALTLLIERDAPLPVKEAFNGVKVYGRAISLLGF